MYIGKHRGRGSASSGEPIHIPENYAGNAFYEAEEAEEKQTPEERGEDVPCMLPACTGNTGAHGGFLPRFDKLFSSDALIILLALLLSGDEDGGELAMILLLLLLF